MKLKKYAMSTLAMLFASTIAAHANTVFIGDSRTVGIYDALHGTSTANKTNVNVTDPDGTTWSCKVGKGLRWMKETGVPQVEDKIHEGTDVVILMGVNDVADAGTVNNYLAYLNEKSQEWTERGADVYYTGIMPVRNDTKDVTNAGIVNWNNVMEQNVTNMTYIDMDESGITYDFSDTYHFKSHTSRDIYKYLITSID